MDDVGESQPKRPNAFAWMSRRVGNQGARLILLVTIVVISGMAVGYAVGYPLRYVDYQATDAVSLDQSALAGNVAIEDSLVTAADLGPGWVPGDAALGLLRRSRRRRLR